MSFNNYGDDRGSHAWNSAKYQQAMLLQQQQQQQQQLQQQQLQQEHLTRPKHGHLIQQQNPHHHQYLQQQQHLHNQAYQQQHHQQPPLKHQQQQQRLAAPQTVYQQHSPAQRRLPEDASNVKPVQSPRAQPTAKTQISPPLDLSESRRQVESPLDLSVKTQKRRADSTDSAVFVERDVRYLEAPSSTKRICIAKRDYAYPPGHPNAPDLDPEHFHRGGMVKPSVPQKHHLQSPEGQHLHPVLQSKSPSISHTMVASEKSPFIAIAQKPYPNVEQPYPGASGPRQMKMPDRRGIGMSHHGQNMARGPHLLPPVAQPQRTRQPSPYDAIQKDPHPSFQRSPQANITESVALKDFFEPTQKVTVTAVPGQSIDRQRIAFQQTSPSGVSPDAGYRQNRTMSSVVPTKHDLKEMEEHRHLTGIQQPAMYPVISGVSQMIPSSTIVQQFHGMHGPVNEYEQRQVQYHKMQEERRREERINAEKAHQLAGMEIQRPMVHMMDIRPSQEAVRHDTHMRETNDALRQHARNLHHDRLQPAQASPQHGIRQMKPDVSSTRCLRVGNPQPLSEMHNTPNVQAMERMQGVLVPAEAFVGRMSMGHVAQTVLAVDGSSVSLQHIGQGRSATASSSVRVEDNPHYRVANAYDKRPESVHEKHTLPHNSEHPIHPSVIQRPQGYIPPRIVRRSISNETDQCRINEPATAMRPVLFHEGIPDRHLNQEHNNQNDVLAFSTSRQQQGTHRDMLSGRDVLKIQQRAAEQRHNETSVHKQQFAKQNTNGIFDNRQHTERRRSIPDRGNEVTHMEQNTMSNSSHSTKRSPPMTKPALVAERSITKGTSGIQNPKDATDPDSFSQFLMRELKKPDDDKTVNPFANRSLLQEFDRSANSSPTPGTELKSDSESLIILPPSSSPCEATKVTETSYTLPLQIAIPGHKGSTSATTVVTETVSKASSKLESGPSKRFMSRKQMILNAFRQEEDQKQTVESDKAEQNDNSRDVFVKPEKESSHLRCAPSPKMPILSPQEKIRNSTGGSHSSANVVEPPNLENVSNPENDKGKIKKSLEEHLHQMISNALNNDPCENESKKASVDAMLRDYMSQSQKNVFLSRQNSQTRNIPVANVAPIVHGKWSDSSSDTLKPKTETKQESDFDEDDEKMAEAVTLSLFASVIKKPENDESNSTTVSETVAVKKQGSKEKTVIKEEPSGESCESLETRNSKGIRSLMDYRLKRHSSSTLNYEMDTLVTAAGENNFATILENDDKMKGRNVFGAFSDIFSEKRFYDFNEHSVLKRGNSDAAGQRRHYPDSDIEAEDMVRKDLTIGYDGDDETGRDLLPRIIGKQSNAKAQADRLIKRARRRHASNGGDGTMRGRPGIHRAGFKDFTPQVLPRRTRSRSLQSQSRRGSRHEGQRRRRHSSAYSNVTSFKRSSTKLRRRRTSSLDREMKSKSRPEHGFYSDNEIELDAIRNAATEATGPSIKDDESTDNEYFNTEFKHFLPNARSDKSSGGLHISKKRKNFFKQKYIFQRKRKQGRGKHPLREHTNTQHVSGDSLKEIYSFQEENTELGPLHLSPVECDIPMPADLKRVIVNKDTGETALHKAARLGFEEVVLYLLATNSVDVNARDNAGFTPLHECVVRGHVRIGKLLLTYGANANVCSTDGIRPIHDAVETDHIEMLRMLISFGADPSLSTYAGRSLLKIAKSDRMRNYIQDYFGDLNGYKHDCHPWQFRASNTYLEPETYSGCPLFEHVPSDPEDESNDMLTMTSKTLFPVRRLSLATNKRVEDYMMLDEVYGFYNLNETERRCLQESHKHQIKKIPKASLVDAHVDSVFLELFSGHYGDEPLPAIRMVDAGPIISKIEKIASSIKVHA